MKKIVLLATMLVAFPAMSFAAIATGTLSINAAVSAAGTCTVANGVVSFADIVPPITTNYDVSNNGFAVTCPALTPYAISLSTGNSGSVSPRAMSDGAQNFLYYNIYTDNSYTTVWGDGTGGTSTVAGVGNSSIQGIFPFVRVPPQATPVAGNYSDAVTITVTY